MTKTSRKFVHHYAGVAIFVGLLSSFGTWTAMRFVTASSAQSAPAAAKPLLVQPLADLPGREVRITLLDRAPGSSVTRQGEHTSHPLSQRVLLCRLPRDKKKSVENTSALQSNSELVY